jgi:hypothetical protein
MSPRRLVALAFLALTSCAPAVQYTRAFPPEHGSAPGMRAQRLSDDGNHERHFAVILAPGDEILGGLTDFAEQEHLAAAQFTAIGGVKDATLGFFDKERQQFRKIPVETQAEVTSLVGDIAWFGDHPVVHVT